MSDMTHNFFSLEAGTTTIRVLPDHGDKPWMTGSLYHWNRGDAVSNSFHRCEFPLNIPRYTRGVCTRCDTADQRDDYPILRLFVNIVKRDIHGNPSDPFVFPLSRLLSTVIYRRGYSQTDPWWGTDLLISKEWVYRYPRVTANYDVSTSLSEDRQRLEEILDKSANLLDYAPLIPRGGISEFALSNPIISRHPPRRTIVSIPVTIMDDRSVFCHGF